MLHLLLWCYTVSLNHKFIETAIPAWCITLTRAHTHLCRHAVMTCCLAACTTGNGRNRDQARSSIRVGHLRTDGASIHDNISTGKADLEAIKAFWCGTINPFTCDIVV